MFLWNMTKGALCGILTDTRRLNKRNIPFHKYTCRNFIRIYKILRKYVISYADVKFYSL